ncbi:hypothetical protein BGZ94_008337 [Podila epigama]|nr:hypothetical protein BGZ94_008337 [Podila epigama]
MPSESHETEDEEMSVAGEVHWDETMEIALCYAAIKFKPVGMHKHFRMINLQRQFNKMSPRPCTIVELWEKLGTMYNLQALDEREDVAGEEEEEEIETDGDELVERDYSFKNSEEFALPLPDFDDLVHEVLRESSRGPSPSPMRTTRAQSQTPSVADSSRASSPEEDDLPKKRRTSRTTKKSDLNETSSPRNSSTSTARRATRAKAETAPTRGRKPAKKLQGLIFE